MIRSRLRRKELSFTVPSTAISRVPDHVWIKIQQARIQRATLNSELMELRNLGEMEGRQIWAYNWEEIHQDENAVGLFWEEGGVQSLVECRLDRIESLLRDYGLAIPLTSTSLVEEESEGMDVLSPSSLRLESNESESPVLALEGPGGHWDEKHAIAQFYKTAFTLPSNVDLRFKRFLSLFNLVAENPLSPTIHSPSLFQSPPHLESIEKTKGKKGDKPRISLKERRVHEQREKAHKAVCCSQPIVQPHWHLWTLLR